MSIINAQIAGLLLLGVLLVYRFSKRKFARTNLLGVEQYRSHGRMILSKLSDGVLLSVGGASLAGACLLAIVEYAPVWGTLASLVTIAILWEESVRRGRL